MNQAQVQSQATVAVATPIKRQGHRRTRSDEGAGPSKPLHDHGAVMRAQKVGQVAKRQHQSPSVIVAIEDKLAQASARSTGASTEKARAPALQVVARTHVASTKTSP